MLEFDSTPDTTFPSWIEGRAQSQGDNAALSFIADDGSLAQRWTYRDLWQRSLAVASLLKANFPQPVSETQPRALLLYPPGLEFMSAFLGCQIARWIPVPTCYPKPHRAMPRLESAAIDCGPAALLCDHSTEVSLSPSRLSPTLIELTRIVTDAISWKDRPLSSSWNNEVTPEDLTLLQYTSGSTNEPKGVMVRHRNLISNLEAIRRGFRLAFATPHDKTQLTGAFWLPFYHDMGLIGGILTALYLGGHAILHSPRSFLQRPVRWLQTISEHRVRVSGAPNFAYQLCVDRISPEQTDGLDLSSWEVAFCGAEPILARTLLDFGNRFSSCGFSDHAFYPCYGLAEATLMAAGGQGPSSPKVISVDRALLGCGKLRVVQDSIRRNGSRTAEQQLVSCGSPVHEMEIVIVDPKSHRKVNDGTVGEIWLRGESVAAGYWNRPEDTERRFAAKLTRGLWGSGGEVDVNYFRTGDLGAIFEGELYVTGRLKDIVILRGRNLYPQDIESSIRQVMGAESGQCAAFSAPAPRGESLAIVAELPRQTHENEYTDLVRAIRREVIETHEVDPRHVWLVRPATIPITTSGKVQRARCRELFEACGFDTRFRYDRASASEQAPIPTPPLPRILTSSDRTLVIDAMSDWLRDWLTARAGVEPSQIDPAKPFSEYGLDSMTAVELSGELEDWTGVELTPVDAWNYPTIEKMSQMLADSLCKRSPSIASMNSNGVVSSEMSGAQ
jgi:acyl-CoA synthetase (AMP-forming)/AMP-acid ligase II/acyl carrier protein